MTEFESLKKLVSSTLQLGPRGETLTAESPLLGALPEFDSMAVVALLTALEEHYGFLVEDDDISADTFASLGSLAAFVDQKLGGQ